MTTLDSTWTGMVPDEDTALAMTDTGGTGPCVLYFNGQFATQRYWRRVIAELGSAYRHVTYDMRARGRSRRWADYSFEANVRDVDAVLAARGVDRPLLVGWSYGAPVALHWASRHLDRVLGVVSVDGAYPYDFTDPATVERIRRLWRRWGWLLPALSPLGKAAKMSAEQHARSNIELLEICAGLGPILDSVAFPVRCVVASGANLGGRRDEMERMRASLDPVLDRNPNIGFTPDDVTMGREALILVRALVPEGFDDYLSRLERAADDPPYMALIKRMWDAAKWEPDDPRVDELATAIADHYLAHPSLLPTPTGLQARTDSAIRYGLLTHHGQEQGPAWARLTTLVEAHLRSAGIEIADQTPTD